MSTNTAIKTWQERRSEYYGVGGSIRIRSDGYFKCGEIAELRAALEAANHRIEDLTTAANRCINDALGMGGATQQGDGELLPLSAHDQSTIDSIEAMACAQVQDRGWWNIALANSALRIIDQLRRISIAQRAGSGEAHRQSPVFPERDESRPADQQGIFRKFQVRRADGSDAPGGKHNGCRYFVLDMDHDMHAGPALAAYARSCHSSHPQLAEELLAELGGVQPDSERDAELYKELLFAVARKFPNESRHETALRYIREAERTTMAAQLGEKVG